MTIRENPNRLHAQLATMITIEAAIAEKLRELIPIVSEHAEAGTLLRELQSLPSEHRQALETRLHKIADTESQSSDDMIHFPDEGLTEHTCNPATTALQTVYTMFSRALIGYSVLRVHATRFLDSSYLEDEGTSMHLAEQFSKDYARAIQQLTRLLHDVLLWELDRDGLACQCICPACGNGICLCSISVRFILDNAWEEAGPFYDAAPIYVHRPKQNSPAAKAGLKRGHIITGVGEQELESWLDLQHVLRNAQSGDEIELKIRQGSGAPGEITLVHP